MNKKNWLCLLLACTFALSFSACKKSDDTDDEDTGPTEWVKSTVFTGDPRSNAAYFQIENTGYVVGGLLRNNTRLKDTWSFSDGQWAKIEDEFPGELRQEAVGFSVGTKGYVGLGWNGSEAFNDFYEYDSQTKKWSTIAIPFDAEARYGAVAFTLGNNAYVGLGSTAAGKTLSDFYKFDPSTKTWESIKTSFEDKRVNAFAFVIGNKAYVGGGFSNDKYPSDFYSFDGTNWTKLNPINRSDDNYTYDITRQSASAFAIGNYGYVVGGSKSSVLGNVWKYDPASDSWTNKHQAFQGSYREGAVAFSFGGKGYVATGKNGTSKFDDNWVFTPVR